MILTFANARDYMANYEKNLSSVMKKLSKYLKNDFNLHYLSAKYYKVSDGYSKQDIN